MHADDFIEVTLFLREIVRDPGLRLAHLRHEAAAVTPPVLHRPLCFSSRVVSWKSLPALETPVAVLLLMLICGTEETLRGSSCLFNDSMGKVLRIIFSQRQVQELWLRYVFVPEKRRRYSIFSPFLGEK